MGQSFGGTPAITIAAKNIPGVLATINFAGGGGGRPDTHPEEPCGADRMSELFANYGGTARIPTLWLYSENDKYWGQTLPRSWLERFQTKAAEGSSCSCRPTSRTAIRSSLATRTCGSLHLWSSLHRAATAHSRAKPAIPSRLSRTPETYTQVLTAWAAKHKSNAPSSSSAAMAGSSTRRVRRRRPHRTGSVGQPLESNHRRVRRDPRPRG